MRKQNVLWKKRIAFLLSAALVFGEVGSNVNIIKAAEVPSNTLTKETEKDIEKDIEKTLPIPEEYISLNETEGMEEPVPVNAKEDNAEDIIPIIGKDDWKAKEQESEVVEEEVNCDGVQKPEEIMPSVIPVVGSGEAEVEPVTVNASDVTTPAAITVGDVISRNGVDNTYGEYVTEEFSFVPEEDGYYSMELKDTYSTQFSLYCGDENGIIYGNRLYIYDDYAGNYTRKLEAGKTYIWGVNYCLYEEDSYFSVEFKKNNELQITGNQVSGTAGKLSSFEYQPEKNTLVQISLESTKGYSYYLDSGSVAYKISNEKPLTFLYEGSDSQIYTLWKNTDEEDNVTLTIKSVTASVITETDVLEAVQDTKTQEVIGVVSKNAWVEFTPKESGYYAFESQKNNGHWQTIGRIYGYTENSETLECIECFDNYNDASNSCGIAKLNEGETYYYYISERYNSRNMEEIPSGMSVMVTKAEEQKISLGREYTFSKASRLTFDVEEGKLYQVLFTSNDQRTYVVDLEGLQNFDLYCYRNFGNVSLNSTWYASNSGEATLSIARLENLETDASYTVEVKEYNAPELPENEVQENKEALDWGDNVVYQFTPETDGTYNFWGICYTDYNSYVAIWKKNEYGIYCVENRGYNDEFDISAELEQGVTYYIVNTNDNNVVAQPGDYLLCRGKSASAEIDLTDKSEGTAEISMYKSAKVKINIPEKGFYQLMATGSADSYHINYEDASVLYNGIGKTVYFENTGEYIINLSREFPKGAGQDNVTFTIAKNNSITSLSTYTSENQAKEEVVLGDSDDVCWYQFTPEETGKYAFLTNRADEDSDVSLIFYREDAEENCMHTMEYNCHNEYGFRKYFLRSSLQAGVTYYVKATTYYDEGVSAELLVMKNPEGTVENMNETVTIDTMHSVSINCNIPEDGIYEVKLQAQKEGVEYAVMTEGTNTSWWWNYEGEVYTKYDYFSAGTRNIIVMPDRMNYGEDKISITLSQVETKTVLQNITMDKDTIWVKYTPEESGYYTIGSVLQKQETEDSPWMSAGIYYKTADDCISYCTSLYGGNDNLERSMYLDNTYEYYIKLYSDTIPVQLTVYAQMNEQVEKTLEQEFELTFAKACDITIPDLTTGWYEVSLEGDTEMYSLAFVNGDNYSEYYSNVGTTKLIYLDSEDLDYNDSRMCFEVIANGLPGENTCTMKISKINVESQEITLGTTISKTAESDVEAYSFTPEKQGYYCITSEGILEDLYFCDSEGYMSYWGSHTLYPGSTYTFYVLNQ